MQNIANKLGWALAGIISLLVVAAAATIVQGGPLDPTDPPGSTMKTLNEIEPRTPISSIPFTISQPGSYYVTRNLTNTQAGFDGIRIEANNVTLDLGGFTLDGAGTGRHGVTTQAGNPRSVTVRNGHVANWTQTGLHLQLFTDLIVDNIQARNNAVGIVVNHASLSNCGAFSNSSTGISAIRSNVSDCVAEQNAIGFNVQSSTLRSCRAELSTDTGIRATRSTVENCHLSSNRWGIVVEEASNVHHNTVSFSGSDGIRMTLSGGSTVADNNVSHNATSGIGEGIHVMSDNNRIVRNNVALGGGIVVGGSFNTIDENSVHTSGGFVVAGSKNTVIRNIATGNGINYQIFGGNNPGPVIDAASATNPLSNTQ